MFNAKDTKISIYSRNIRGVTNYRWVINAYISFFSS
jgi:hypothetical protein